MLQPVNGLVTVFVCRSSRHRRGCLNSPLAVRNLAGADGYDLPYPAGVIHVLSDGFRQTSSQDRKRCPFAASYFTLCSGTAPSRTSIFGSNIAGALVGGLSESSAHSCRRHIGNGLGARFNCRRSLLARCASGSRYVVQADRSADQGFRVISVQPGIAAIISFEVRLTDSDPTCCSLPRLEVSPRR
jgi:hypothetical protein